MENNRPMMKRIGLALSVALAVAVLAAPDMKPALAADNSMYVDAKKPGDAVQLYNTPGDKDSAMTAQQLPLRVTGPAHSGFYPVTVNEHHYWVNGMDVKTIRDTAQARCSQSAGVVSGGTLGAASNRCQ